MFYLLQFDSIKIAFLPLAYLVIIFLAAFGVFKGLKSVFMGLLTIVILLYISTIVLSKLDSVPLSLVETVSMMNCIFVAPFQVVYTEITKHSQLKFLSDEKNKDYLIVGLLSFIYVILALFYLPARSKKPLKIIKYIIELLILAALIYLAVIGFNNPEIGVFTPTGSI